MKLASLLALALALTGAGCGYRVAGGPPKVLPPSIHTIAVPAFENQTLVARVEQTLSSAVIRELITRTKYRIQSNTAGADATLHGVITSVFFSPSVYDPTAGRTTGVLLTVTLRMTIVSSETGAVLYQTNNWTYREPYEVSEDPATYLGEDQPALERLSQNVAASLVSTLIEGLK